MKATKISNAVMMITNSAGRMMTTDRVLQQEPQHDQDDQVPGDGVAEKSDGERQRA